MGFQSKDKLKQVKVGPALALSPLMHSCFNFTLNFHERRYQRVVSIFYKQKLKIEKAECGVFFLYPSSQHSGLWPYLKLGLIKLPKVWHLT